MDIKHIEVKKCCWNRLIQSRTKDSDCDSPEGESCITIRLFLSWDYK